MATSEFTKITDAERNDNGVKALSNRPNETGLYGVGGLTAQQLKEWFDKFANLLADRFNAVCDIFKGANGADVAQYIKLPNFGSYENLRDVLTAIGDGTFANAMMAYASASAESPSTLQAIINNMAAYIATATSDISALDSGKLSKVTSTASYKRAYIIMPDGTQSTVLISESAVAGNIPLFNSNGQLCCAIPTSSGHTASKGYVDTQDLLLGSQIDLTIDRSTFKLKAKLKNTAGTVLSESTEIDLPLEQMIINGSYNSTTKKLTLTLRNDQDSVDNNTIEIDISSLISGLVAESRTVNGKPLSGNIVLTASDVGAYSTSETYSKVEIDQKEIYAHAAFHSEESETAKNYTKGGGTDKKFRQIEKDTATTVSLSMDTDYKLTVSLLNKKGVILSSGVVDLPIESLITQATYSNGTLTLTFQSGDTANIDISSLISGLVPDTRTINGKRLNANIVLDASDVGAYPTTDTYTKTEVSNLLQALQVQINDISCVAYSVMSDEAEKARGYVKGGQIDKQLKAIIGRITTLENRE